MLHRFARSKEFLRSRTFLLLDQLCFSLTNFLLTITLARSYSELAFAAFGVGLSIALMAQAVQRNLYIMRFALLPPRAGRRYMSAVVAEHIIVVALLALVASVWAVAALFLDGSGFVVLTAFSTIVCGFVYFQVEFDRAVQVKRNSPAGAFVLSFLYLCTILVLAGLARFIALPFPLFMAGLVVFCALKGAWLAIFVARPRWRWGIHFMLQDLKHYGLSALMIAATSAGYTHVPVMVLAAEYPPSEVATFIAVRSLMQPVMLIFRSFDAFDKNRFRNASGGSIFGARRVFWRTFLGYGAAGLAGILIMSIAPNAIIRLAYGAKYAGAGMLLLAWCLFATLIGMVLPVMSVVRLVRKDHTFATWSVAAASLGTLLALVLCRPFGSTGAMAALLSGAALSVIGGLITIRSIVFGRIDGQLPSYRVARAPGGRRKAAPVSQEGDGGALSL